MKFHVTYFYLATGMEGIPDTKDYGIIEADSAEDAKTIVTNKAYTDNIEYAVLVGYDEKQWKQLHRGCLKAEFVG